MYTKHTIQLDIIEQKIKLQFEVSVIVVTELKDSKPKVKERISSNNVSTFGFTRVTNV